jgi:inorganic pyrophosphatase
MEVRTDLSWTPIMQDVTKTSKLRYYDEEIPWNYGMIPQTYEDPGHRWPAIKGLPGDGDPLDVIEISKRRCPMGSITKVRILGALALIDEGEVDWKIIAIRETSDMVSIDPEELDRIREWFRSYKKVPNTYGLKGACISVKDATSVIELANKLYTDTYSKK